MPTSSDPCEYLVGTEKYEEVLLPLFRGRVYRKTTVVATLLRRTSIPHFAKVLSAGDNGVPIQSSTRHIYLFLNLNHQIDKKQRYFSLYETRREQLEPLLPVIASFRNFQLSTISEKNRCYADCALERETGKRNWIWLGTSRKV